MSYPLLVQFVLVGAYLYETDGEILSVISRLTLLSKRLITHIALVVVTLLRTHLPVDELMIKNYLAS